MDSSGNQCHTFYPQNLKARWFDLFELNNYQDTMIKSQECVNNYANREEQTN